VFLLRGQIAATLHSARYYSLASEKVYRKKEKAAKKRGFNV
jgi:hypothetical protein